MITSSRSYAALLSLVAATGFSASAALAQTSVTIYGIVDLAVAHEKIGDKSKLLMDSGTRSAAYGSRLGFSGTEDLGGGLKAGFALENGFNPDDGTAAQSGRLFGRTAYVSLAGELGEVRLGRQYSPIFIALARTDPFGIGLAGNGSRFFPVYKAWMDNTVQYRSPTFAGLSGQVSYGFGEVAGDNAANREFGGALGYSKGPLYATLAYHNFANDVVVAGQLPRSHATYLGGTYDFGVVKMHAASAWAQFDGGLTLKPGTLSAAHRTHTWMLGATIPFGASSFAIDYIRSSNRDIDQENANSTSVAYLYPLSKRTTLYTSAAYTLNDANAKFSSGVAGASARLFNVGVTHKF